LQTEWCAAACHNSLMNVRHAVIYVPGLGDSRIGGQLLAMKLWRLQGVRAELFQMNWSDGEPYEPKQRRLLARVDRLLKQGYRVSLVGASAGGSAVINAYAERQDQLHCAVGICGKLLSHGLSSVHPKYYQKNPAFLESMRRLQGSDEHLTKAHRERILSLRPLYDESVPIAETRIPGSKERIVPVFGHVFGIAYGLLFGSFGIIRFIKRLPLVTAGDTVE